MRKLSSEQISRLAADELHAADRYPVVVILENIRSAYNVGAIFRTADAALVRRILLAGFTPDPSHRGVRKSALGAGEFVPWERASNARDAARRLADEGYTIAALEITDTPTDPRSIDRSHFPLAVVVGNEVDGVSDAVLADCDLALELPQFGAKQSLNVSVAAGVALYDVVRAYRSL
jgi:tRNA G18 (ribose-2'-O)-methylase SpoU